MVLVIRLHAIQEARVVSWVLRLHILWAMKKIGKEQYQWRELNQQHLHALKHTTVGEVGRTRTHNHRRMCANT